MAEQCAWVTLATNDSYSLGALVLAHSLRRVNTKYQLAILVTPGVTPIMKDRLASVFSQVVTVDVLDSKDAAHLALLSRPELGITFTKLHCWNLTQFTKCVFLDADTLIFQNCDELFEREELSAAPDVGWPDCFNSGVYVYKPSKETFDALIKLAREKGSFDGGDQGLLNQFFSDWARGDIKKHLPFLYNVCSTAFYSYLPALKQYGGDMKIMHFIGNVKPWLHKFNWGSRTVTDESYLKAPLQYWWDIFLENVHPSLDVGMVRWECGASNEPRYHTPHNDESHFPWHHAQPTDEERPSSAVPHPADFYDPWESYTPGPAQAPTPPSSRRTSVSDIKSNETTSNYTDTIIYQPKPWYETYTPEEEPASEDWTDASIEINHPTIQCGPGGSHCGTLSYDYQYEHSECSVNTNDWQNTDFEPQNYIDDQQNDDCEVIDKPFIEEVKPRHPYDNYYLLHTPRMDNHGCKRCTHEELSPAPSPSPTPSAETETDLQAGLAGALSQLSIGSSESTPAVEEHLRRQGWEAGNIDYMGADSFDNIWAKISQTLSATESAPAPVIPEPIPVVEAQPAPVAVVEEPKVEAAPAPSEPIVESAEIPKAEPAITEPAITEPAITEPAITEPAITEPAKTEPIVESAAPVEAPKVEVASQPAVSESTEAVVPAPSDTDSSAQESQATTDENQDSKQAETIATELTAPLAASPSPKTIEKLVCHLKPTGGVEPLLTPENEYEDASSIALRIIESEALSSPIITSATPPITSPVRPAIPQNIKDLSIDTCIPETPPVSGPVSLAQIGIIPKKDTKLPEPIMECPIAPKSDVIGTVDIKKEEPSIKLEIKNPITTICEIPKPIVPETVTPIVEQTECVFICKEEPSEIIISPIETKTVDPLEEITAPPKSKTKKTAKKQPPPVPELPKLDVGVEISPKEDECPVVKPDTPETPEPKLKKPEEPAKPKKAPKKPPSLKKSEVAAEDMEVKLDETKKGEDAPVPPPRKKEKKPKK